MKRLIKRVVGGLVVAVGITGVVFGGYAIRQTWLTAERAGREVPHAIGELESIGQSVHRQGVAAGELMVGTRQRLNAILGTIEDLATNRENAAAAAVLDRIDAELLDRLDRADEFVRSMQASLESASHAVTLLESIPFLGRRPPSTGIVGENSPSSLADSLTEVSLGLQQMTRILGELRAGRTVDPANLTRLSEVLQGVDVQLQSIQTEIDEFSAQTNLLVTRLADARKTSERWIKRTTALCTLFFVCFAFSQLHLVIAGWRAIAEPPLVRVHDGSEATPVVDRNEPAR